MREPADNRAPVRRVGPPDPIQGGECGVPREHVPLVEGLDQGGDGGRVSDAPERRARLEADARVDIAKPTPHHLPRLATPPGAELAEGLPAHARVPVGRGREDRRRDRAAPRVDGVERPEGMPAQGRGRWHRRASEPAPLTTRAPRSPSRRWATSRTDRAGWDSPWISSSSAARQGRPAAASRHQWRLRRGLTVAGVRQLQQAADCDGLLGVGVLPVADVEAQAVGRRRDPDGPEVAGRLREQSPTSTRHGTSRRRGPRPRARPAA